MGLNKKVLMVIAPKNFKDEEYFIPKEIFEDNGIQVTTTSSNERATSVYGKDVKVDLLLNDADTNYDAVVFIGGPGATVYYNDTKAINLAKSFYREAKVVSAICLAPVILANAGLLTGREATVFTSEASKLTARKAIYTGNKVTADGLIITANGPSAAKEFANKIVEVLSK